MVDGDEELGGVEGVVVVALGMIGHAPEARGEVGVVAGRELGGLVDPGWQGGDVGELLLPLLVG